MAAAGLPILCEKPCGVTARGHARARRASSTRAGVALQVAYWRRFVPELVALRERIAAGELGEVLLGVVPAVGRRAAGGRLSRAQRRDLRRHGRARVRPGPLADRGRLRVASRAVASSVVTDPDAPTTPDGAQVLATARARGATVSSSPRAPLPRRRHGERRGLRHRGPRVFDLFLDPADGERAQLEALATPGGGLRAATRAVGAVTRRDGRRRRRRAGASAASGRVAGRRARRERRGASASSATA